MLPNFLIVGAHKAGTESMRMYLMEHPQVFMTEAHEPNFFALEGTAKFNPDGTPTRPWMLQSGAVYTIDEYEALFDGVTDERAVGEKSPIYLRNPDAPARIKERLPGVRLVAVLRNP